MSAIRPQKLHHAAIRIRDLEESRRFYEGLLGLARATRPDMGFAGEWYAIGDAQLHLIQIPKHGEGLDPADPHFAFEVDDLAAAKRSFDGAGLA